MLWAVTTNGAAMPLDAEPHRDGNVEMTGYAATGPGGRTGPEVRVVARQDSLFDDDIHTRWMPHAATCAAIGTVDRTQRGGRTSAKHPQSSRTSAAGVRVGSQQAAILIDLLNCGDGTAHELAAAPTLAATRPGISPNQVGSRLGELRAKGLARYVSAGDGTELTRPTVAGVANVHVLTAAGRVEASRLRATP